MIKRGTSFGARFQVRTKAQVQSDTMTPILTVLPNPQEALPGTPGHLTSSPMVPLPGSASCHPNNISEAAALGVLGAAHSQVSPAPLDKWLLGPFPRCHQLCFLFPLLWDMETQPASPSMAMADRLGSTSYLVRRLLPLSSFSLGLCRFEWGFVSRPNLLRISNAEMANRFPVVH